MRISAVLPPTGLGRRLCTATLLQSLGNGVFVTSSVLFFVRFLDLTAAEVGLGLSVSAAVAAVLTLPLSRLGDRLGRKRLWTACLGVDVVCFVCYPAVGTFGEFLAVVTVLATSEAVGATSRAAYTISILPPKERVETFAWTRSAFNVGFSCGAGASAVVVALAQPRQLFLVPWTMAALLVLTVALVVRLPTPPSQGADRPDVPDRLPRRRSVLRDMPFLRFALASGIQNADEPLLLVVVPLWIAGLDGVPDVMIPLALGTNTVLVILAQVRLSRGIDDLVGGVAAMTTAGWFLCLGSLVLMATGANVPVAATIALVLGAVVLITVGEIKSSASGWVLSAELSPERSRAEYQAALRLTGQFWRAVTPAAGVALVSGLGSAGWLVVAALFLVSGPAVRATAFRCPRPEQEHEQADLRG